MGLPGLARDARQCRQYPVIDEQAVAVDVGDVEALVRLHGLRVDERAVLGVRRVVAQQRLPQASGAAALS